MVKHYQQSKSISAKSYRPWCIEVTHIYLVLTVALLEVLQDDVFSQVRQCGQVVCCHGVRQEKL